MSMHRPSRLSRPAHQLHLQRTSCTSASRTPTTHHIVAKFPPSQVVHCRRTKCFKLQRRTSPLALGCSSTITLASHIRWNMCTAFHPSGSPTSSPFSWRTITTRSRRSGSASWCACAKRTRTTTRTPRFRSSAWAKMAPSTTAFKPATSVDPGRISPRA